MNRYRAGGQSKATANTLCQKCLKKGKICVFGKRDEDVKTESFQGHHYSFECTRAQQERPYVPRPSRTQQLLNPKLVPKITAQSQATLPSDPARKRDPDDVGREENHSRVKRVRSVSSSSRSGSTISTRSSRSLSPPARKGHTHSERSGSHRPDRSDRITDGRPAQQQTLRGSRRHRERSLRSSRSRSDSRDRRADDQSPAHGAQPPRNASRSRGQHRGRSLTPLRSRSNSRQSRSKDEKKPAPRHRSRSPRHPHARDTIDGVQRDTKDASEKTPVVSVRERSLSPYSKRVAMARTAR